MGGEGDAGLFLDIYGRFVGAVLAESEARRRSKAMGRRDAKPAIGGRELGEVICKAIPRFGQRQDSLAAQLSDLYLVAVRLGMYDAADALLRISPSPRSAPDAGRGDETREGE